MGGSIIRDNYEATEKALRQKLDSVTQLLCSLCGHLEETSQVSILETIDNGKLTKWWENHKKADAKRRADQIEKQERDALRKQEEQRVKDVRDKVLKKLTPEEKRILGVN
ncbi:MAG: hypothetical protein Q7S43_00800 [bacterium]|nr:hypothetical protein [bacterium]